MNQINTNRMRSAASILHRSAFHLMNDAADEIDRLRDVIDTLNTTYDVDAMLRAIKAGE